MVISWYKGEKAHKFYLKGVFAMVKLHVSKYFHQVFLVRNCSNNNMDQK